MEVDDEEKEVKKEIDPEILKKMQARLKPTKSAWRPNPNFKRKVKKDVEKTSPTE